jgi:mutator protein MutT
VVAALIRRDGVILITKRPPDVHLGGLWEFPGGKVEDDESLEAALERELQEEIGVHVTVLDKFFEVQHDYPTRSVQLHFFNCHILSGEPRAIHVAELRWVPLDQLHQFSFPEADLELISLLSQQ